MYTERGKTLHVEVQCTLSYVKHYNFDVQCTLREVKHYMSMYTVH